MKVERQAPRASGRFHYRPSTASTANTTAAMRRLKTSGPEHDGHADKTRCDETPGELLSVHGGMCSNSVRIGRGAPGGHSHNGAYETAPEHPMLNAEQDVRYRSDCEADSSVGEGAE